jgi:hypothetical protein
MPMRELAALPREILTQIAFHLVVDDDGLGQHPSPLIPFLLSCRAVHEAISFGNNPQLYNRLFRATFDHKALERRYGWMKEHLSDVAGRGKESFDLFADPRSWAIDYKVRWEQSWRMRQVVKHAKIEVPGVCDLEQLTADLWNVWFLLTENGEVTIARGSLADWGKTGRTSGSSRNDATSNLGSWCTTRRTCSQTLLSPAIRRKPGTKLWASGVRFYPEQVSSRPQQSGRAC